MAKITLSESQLRSIIEEAVNDELQRIDEGFFNSAKNMGRSIFGAFRGDAERTGDAMADAGRSVMNGVGNVGRAIGNAGRAVGRAVGNAGRAVGDAKKKVKKYGDDRLKSIKGQYKAYQDYGKIEDLLNTINKLHQDGVLHGPAMEQAIAVITKELKGAMGRSKGAVTSWRN